MKDYIFAFIVVSQSAGNHPYPREAPRTIPMIMPRAALSQPAFVFARSAIWKSHSYLMIQ